LSIFQHVADFSTLYRGNRHVVARNFAAIARETAVCKACVVACPLCQTRKEKRSCPALGRSICTVCCGTKRLVEIDCPSSCPHLAASREHPAAVVRKQQEVDVAALMPSMAGLTERQHQLFFLFQSVIARSKPDGLARLTDEDVAEAAAACASTIETAARGVLYDHMPTTLPAQKLAGEFRALLVEVRQQGATVYDREAAIALRAIERGARTLTRPGETTAYLALMGRLLQVNKAAEGAEGHGAAAGQPRAGSIIIP
jgi:hypothetical protein